MTLPGPQITLYPYQAAKIDAALRHVKAGRDVLLEEPTGAGKTLQGVAFLALSIGKAMTHAVVIAPQRQIEEGFLGRNDSMILWPSGANRSRPIRIPAGFVRAAREGSHGAVSGILAYLATPDPGYALACTHAAMTSLFRNRLGEFPEHLGRCLLFVDEAHHIGADGLSLVSDEWAARGGCQVGASATPFRGDGIDLVRKGTIHLRRTMAEHMEEGFAPGRVSSRIVAIGHKGDHVTAREFAGEVVTKKRDSLDEIAQAKAACWVEGGRQKAIVRIPALGKGSKPLVAILARAFRKVGARVLDATGVGLGKQRKFIAALEAERGRSYAESQFDVIIGCKRVMEGSDWPHCSQVLCLGIPKSIGAVVQLLGRAMRRKAAGHPFADVAEIVFFVPCAGGDALRDLGLEHSRHVLLTATYLADYTMGEEWALVKEVRKGLGIKPGDEVEILIDDALAINPDVVAEAKFHIADAIDQRPGISLSELVEAVTMAMPTAARNDVVRIVMGVKAAEDTPEGERIRGEIREGFEGQVGKATILPEIIELRHQVFNGVLANFRDATLADPKSIKAISSQVHTITAGDMRGFAQRLREAWGDGCRLTMNMILRWIQEWKRRTGDYPKWNSGRIPGFNENWAIVDASLTKGLRGLKGGSSLADLIEETFGRLKQDNRPDFSEVHFFKWRKQVREWVDEARARTGVWPSRDSGEIPNSGGETWLGVDIAIAEHDSHVARYRDLQDFLMMEYGSRTQQAARRRSMYARREKQALSHPERFLDS